jgi:hypothetical protein
MTTTVGKDARPTAARRGRGPRTASLTALTALALVSLAGCQDGTSPSVVGASATAGPAPSGTPTASATATSTGTAPVLSDTGLGDLKLGMTLEQARDLGLVGKLAYPNDTKICNQYHGKQGVKSLYFTDGKLIIIVAGPKIWLDTGIGVGSVYADLKYSYGDRLDTSGARDFSLVTISAPGAPFKAHYRMDVDPGATLQDARITTITLQSDDQQCYE